MLRRALPVLLALPVALLASPLAASPIDFFPAGDADTLLRLEFTNNTQDQSGSGRHATDHVNSYVPGAFGLALRVAPPADPLTTAVGFDWSTYAHLLVLPYTVEMLLTSFDDADYRKLFSPDDTSDTGWYLNDGNFRSYSDGGFLPGIPPTGRLFYLAVVVSEVADAPVIDVWVDGVKIGSSATFGHPPTDAVFFRDDTANSTSRPEQFDGTIDALRISDRARTPVEIAATYAASRVVFQDDFEGDCPPPWSDFVGLICFS